MVLNDEMVRQTAEELLQAEKTRTPVPAVSQRFPEINAERAYSIQLHLTELKREAGRTIVGKKIGLTSIAMQRLLGVDQPDYGHIFDNMLVQDRTSLSIDELIQPKIEPEIAFILAENIKGPGVTPIQVLAATRFIVPALEVIDSRIENWKITLCDTIADNASSGRVVLGGKPVKADGVDIRLLGMVLEKNGEVIDTAAGAAALGHPANAIAWLANVIAPFDESLKAGEVIMPGALTGASDVSRGDFFQASFYGMGSVSVRFA